jgi:streptomycin 6-kinase
VELETLAARQPQFVQTVAGLHGEAGFEWLARLPEQIASWEERWRIRVGEPFPGLSYNFAAPADGEDGARFVFKLCIPNAEFVTEIAALRHFAGQGSARLVAADEHAGAMLLERLEPGTPLFSLDDDVAATSVAAGVMRRLWRPAPAEHPFPTVERWGRGFQRLRARFPDGGPFPRALLEEAESLFADLLASSAPPVVLHGDLHHWNVLAAAREPWLAIDPKGVVGEPAYEVGALLRNPMPHLLDRPDAERILARRVAQLAEELGFDRTRIRGWGVAQAILSAWWCVEDGVDCLESALRFAGLLSRVRV